MQNLRLPIIIFLEVHYDHKVYQAYTSIFGQLRLLGYDTLGQEFAFKVSGLANMREKLAENIKNIHTMLDGILKRMNHPDSLQSWVENVYCRSESNIDLTKLVTKEELLSLSLSQLETLLSCNSPEASADNILLLQAHETWLKNLASFQEILKIEIVDSAHDFSKPFNEEVARRNQVIGSNVTRLYKEGRNLMLPLGKLHLPGIVAYLHDQGLLKDTLFFDLHSIKSPVHRGCGPITTNNANISPVWLEIFKRQCTKSEADAIAEYESAINIYSITVDEPDVDPIPIINAQILNNMPSVMNKAPALLFAKDMHLRDCRHLGMDHDIKDLNADMLFQFTMLMIIITATLNYCSRNKFRPHINS